MSNLKPCPFCGAKATEPKKQLGGGRPRWETFCTSWCFTMVRGSKKELTMDWNTRQPHPAIKAVYDEWKINEQFLLSFGESEYEFESKQSFIEDAYEAIRKAVEDAD